MACCSLLIGCSYGNEAEGVEFASGTLAACNASEHIPVAIGDSLSIDIPIAATYYEESQLSYYEGFFLTGSGIATYVVVLYELGYELGDKFEELIRVAIIEEPVISKSGVAFYEIDRSAELYGDPLGIGGSWYFSTSTINGFVSSTDALFYKCL